MSEHLHDIVHFSNCTGIKERKTPFEIHRIMWRFSIETISFFRQLEIGAIVYAQVTVAHKDLGVEVSCVVSIDRFLSTSVVVPD